MSAKVVLVKMAARVPLRSLIRLPAIVEFLLWAPPAQEVIIRYPVY